MSKLTVKNLKLFDIISQQSHTFIRTPEPTELCELDSMYILADWLYYAYLNNMISQERYINLYTYLDTIPIIGKYHRNLSVFN
jgi:hypothetical protein